MTEQFTPSQKTKAALQTILQTDPLGQIAQSHTSLMDGIGLTQTFQRAGALEPPYDPAQLTQLVQSSATLRPNIDAYAANIDGFGHRFEPVIDLQADDADKQIQDCMIQEQHQKAAGLPNTKIHDPSQEEIAQRKKQLQNLARQEKARLECFFDSCCYNQSFVNLRRRTRQDLETTGNAYWEVLRNARGQIARLVYVPAYTMRLLPLDEQLVEVKERRRISKVTYETITTPQRLRRFVQIVETQQVFFKSFGDPRILSPQTGAVFDDMVAFNATHPNQRPANEIIHFKLHPQSAPDSPYGVPRWIGALLSVAGSKQMEEINYTYFENKRIPPLALLVSGGTLPSQTVSQMEQFFEDNLKGKDNFHKILIIESESGKSQDHTSPTKLELKNLSSIQQKEALFLKYDERNIDKVGATFRLPRLLRGDCKNYNRSVADAHIRFAEDQVFQPEREAFDAIINQQLLADMGICLWRFRSQSATTRAPERLTLMVQKLVRAGVLTPEDGRYLAEDIFSRKFKKIKESWVKRPIALTQGELWAQNPHHHHQGTDEEIESLMKAAKKLYHLRDELDAEEKRKAEKRKTLALRYFRGEAETNDDEYDGDRWPIDGDW